MRFQIEMTISLVFQFPAKKNVFSFKQENRLGGSLAI